jgi:O-antigen/teichoic acid export membrane protein
MDRNWEELMHELRVTQTGIQILTGFLLTVPFQQRFAGLDSYQRTTYLGLVAGAVLTTALMVAPVSLHRQLFRRHLKSEIVAAGNRLARQGIAIFGVVLSGTVMLLFDVVAGRLAGLVAGAATAAVLVGFWWLLAVGVFRRAR